MNNGEISPKKKIDWLFIPETLLYLALFLAAQLLVSFVFYLPFMLAQLSGELGENISLTESWRLLYDKTYSDFLPVYTPIISIVSTVLGVGILWLIFRKKDAPAIKNLGFVKPEKSVTVFALPLALGLQIFFSVFIDALLTLPGMAETARQMSEYSSALEGPDKLLSAFALVVGAAVNEEIFFRGAIMRSMDKRGVNVAAAVIIQAVLFAVCHELPIRMLYAFPLGLALGLLRVKGRSILPCLVLHATFNCCAYWENVFPVVPVWGKIALAVVSVLIVAASLWLIMRKKAPDAA